MPKQWLCIKSANVENMSTCFASSEQCDVGREKLVAAGARYTGCIGQEAASCFTFHSNLMDRTSFDCSATIAACERQRGYAVSEAKTDVRDVGDCTTWRASTNSDAAPSATEARRYGGDEIYCSDMAANGQVIHRYACQFLREDCEAMAEGVERSGEAAFRAQGKDGVDVTMGQCKRTTESAFCSLLATGYICTALTEHCVAMAAEGIRSGKVDTVGRCIEWRPGRFL